MSKSRQRELAGYRVGLPWLPGLFPWAGLGQGIPPTVSFMSHHATASQVG
jgi:hypothetical protein